MSRVTIIIPCFNAGAYVAASVESALAQTHHDVEVVVVNDGSTDQRTVDVLEELRGPRTKIIHQPNGGPSAARNRAVREASGDYILPLDADDLFDPTYAAKAAALLDADPDLGIVYCDAMRFGAASGIWRLPAYTVREMVIDNVIFCSGMYRRADWERAGGYNEKLRHGMEDYEFWIKLIAIGRGVAKIEEPLFHYRIQEVSRTTTFMEDNSNVVATYAEIFRSNADFFARHAEYLFEHRFGLYREIDHYRYRYGRIDRWFESSAGLKYVGRLIHKIVSAFPRRIAG